MEFARKKEWKENGRFWQSVDFARKGKCKERQS